MQNAFYQSELEHPHGGRARAIVKAHPEVRELMVRNPCTALIALSIVMRIRHRTSSQRRDAVGQTVRGHIRTILDRSYSRFVSTRAFPHPEMRCQVCPSLHFL